MTHRLTLRAIEPVTHDTNHLVFDRPGGYSWRPGQATLLRLDRDGWRDQKRPFTFVSDPDVTEEHKPGLEHGQIDGDVLDRHVAHWEQHFYVCGPRGMEDALTETLKTRGAPEERIVSEDHPD